MHGEDGLRAALDELRLGSLRAIVREHQIDAVLVTAPPFSAFLIGNALKREFPEIQLTSDFRDSWIFTTRLSITRTANIRAGARASRSELEARRLIISSTGHVHQLLHPGQRSRPLPE